VQAIDNIYQADLNGVTSAHWNDLKSKQVGCTNSERQPPAWLIDCSSLLRTACLAETEIDLFAQLAIQMA